MRPAEGGDCQIRKLHEERKASLQEAAAVIIELMDEKEKIGIERDLLMDESMTTLKQCREDIKEIMEACVENAKAMNAMKKMAEERQEEMAFVEGMKKENEEILVEQPIKNVVVN